MRLPGWLVGLLLGGAFLPVACGDDSDGGNSDRGSGEAGEAGSPEPAAGGSQGSGATSSSGAGDGAFGGDEAVLGGGANEGGSGNAVICTPRQQIPDPVVGVLRVPASCPAPSACACRLTPTAATEPSAAMPRDLICEDRAVPRATY